MVLPIARKNFKVLFRITGDDLITISRKLIVFDEGHKILIQVGIGCVSVLNQTKVDPAINRQ